MIRKAEIKDISKIIEMGEAMHAESSYRVMPFSKVKCGLLIQKMLLDINSLAIVAEKEGSLIGMFGAYATPHYFSEEVMCTDYLLYIKPEFRGSSLAVRFIKEYINWAKSRNIRFMFAGVTTEIKESETAVKLYEKLGFRKAGIVLKKEV